MENVLSQIYYDAKNPASYGGVEKLFKEAKKFIPTLTRQQVENWLQSQFTYTLHKKAIYNFKRNKILVAKVNQQFQADLVDLQQYSRQNSGFKYLLTVIDCFSKFAFAIPLKTKTGKEVAQAFKKIFKERTPQYVQTDKGKEFLNKDVQEIFDSFLVKHFTTKDDKIKCAIIERWNRTLKEKMFKYFTAKGTRRYIDILPQLVQSYNNSKHRTTKFAPINVNKESEPEVFFNIYKSPDVLTYLKQQKGKLNFLKTGDTVRRQHKIKPMEKGYYPKWTDETFKVEKINKKLLNPMITLKDQQDNKISRRFYAKELQKVKPTLHRVEKVIKTRTRNGIREYYVKWLGYPNSFNSWTRDIETLNVDNGESN